jgi:hypothetical protein
MQFKPILLLLAAAPLLQSCWKPSGTWKNDQISSSYRSDFHDLDKQLLQALKADDNNQMQILESRELLNNGSVEKAVDVISNLYKKSDYELGDEYYVVNKHKTLDTILNNSKNINNYNLLYYNTSREMYIAFFMPKKNLDNQWMFVAVFSKLSYGWKLTMLDMGMYKVDGKTAPELCGMAQDEYKKHYLVNAANLIQLAYSIKRPVAIRAYSLEDTIEATYERIGEEASSKIKFPMVLNDVPTHPSIFNIFEGEFNDGYYPQVYYQSSIKLSDTVALRKENNEIMKSLPKLLPGIDKDTPWLLFTAFNKKPNPTESVPRYEMDNRLK